MNYPRAVYMIMVFENFTRMFPSLQQEDLLLIKNNKKSSRIFSTLDTIYIVICTAFNIISIQFIEVRNKYKVRQRLPV